MLLLPFKKHSWVTVSIQDNEIRFLQLSKHSKGMSVENMAIESLPAQWMIEGRIQDKPLLNQMLKNVMGDAPKGLPAAFALPAQSVIHTTLKMPKEFNQRELFLEFKENISSYLPGVEEDLFFDFAVVGENELEQTIVLTACRKALLNEYRALFRLAKLKLIMVDIDYYALARAAYLPLIAKKATSFVVLEIKLNYLHFLLIRENYLYFSKLCSISATDAFDEITQHLRLIFKKLSTLSKEIQQMIVVGEISDKENLNLCIGKIETLPVFYSHPFADISLPASFNRVDLENKMLVNLGLALRGIKCS